MASYTADSDDIGIHAKTLVAATVDTLTFDQDLEQVEIINLTGDAIIYFTVDGSTPTVAGQNTYVLPAAVGSLTLWVPTPGDTVVKLISSGTPTYSVQKA